MVKSTDLNWLIGSSVSQAYAFAFNVRDRSEVERLREERGRILWKRNARLTVGCDKLSQIGK